LLEEFPEEIAIVHVPAHQQGTSPEVQEKNLAAKESALHPEISMLHLIPVSRPHPKPLFSLARRKLNLGI
jgi:hypothetical protein